MRKVLIVTGMFFCAFFLSNCELSYEPLILPVEFSYNTATGEVTVHGSMAMITSVGRFKISNKFPDDEFSDKDIILIIRDQKLGIDDIYIIHNNSGEKIEIITFGKTRISFDNNVAIVDVTEGEIVNISFQVVKKDDINWLNAPFSYRPWVIFSYVLETANSTFQSKFVWIFPGFIVGGILYILSLVVIPIELLLMAVFGIGLLFGSIHLRNVYYTVVVVGPLIILARKFFISS